MKNVVIAVDASRHALDPLALGRRLGSTMGAPVIVCHIAEPGSTAPVPA